MKRNQSSSSGFSKLALLAVGGYLLWKNRFKVQELLESQGVKTPWMNENVGDAFQSGAAKISGATKRTFQNDTSAPLV